MIKCKTALLTLAMIALLGAPVLAEDEPSEDPNYVFALKRATAQFEQADVDKDKKLTKDEFTNGKGMKGKNFETYDINGDSSLSFDEWKAEELKKF